MSALDTLRSKALVETDWLAERLDDPNLRIFDCTVWLRPDPPRIYRVESARGDYNAGHIPNSAFLELTEVSDTNSSFNFMMPTAERFAAAMAGRGVSDDSHVILYARESIQWATRVWWMLRAIGFDNASVLNGGYDKWQAEGREISTEPFEYSSNALTPRPRQGLFCDKDETRGAIDEGRTCVINALRPSLHDGSEPVNYGRPGRIANSINIPAVALLDPKTKAYKPWVELESMFKDAGVLDKDRVVLYCGGGIAATSDAFVLTMLGKDNVTVYDASMSEWANDPEMPMETG